MAAKPLDQNALTPEPRSFSPEALASEILEKLTYSIGKDPIVARPHDWLTATVLTVRDRVIDIWMESTRETWRNSQKRVYYFSMEFLIGRLLRDSMSNLELMGSIREALQTFGVDSTSRPPGAWRPFL